MLEQIAQIGPMLILAGLTIGLTAEAVSRAGGHGLIPEMVVSVAGSVLAAAIVWSIVSHLPGMLAMFVIGCAGAGLAVVGQRSLWPSPRLGT